MAKKQILIRDVPEVLYKWIEKERHGKRQSQKEFLLKVLEKAASYSVNPNQPPLFYSTPDIARIVPSKFPFTFIDLFAGIGGMRLGLQWAGGRCVFTSEWDRYSDLPPLSVPVFSRVQSTPGRLKFLPAGQIPGVSNRPGNCAVFLRCSPSSSFR